MQEACAAAPPLPATGTALMSGAYVMAVPALPADTVRRGPDLLRARGSGASSGRCAGQPVVELTMRPPGATRMERPIGRSCT